ncbi:MAG: tyrosine-type recombinase/integrase [Acidimicrobiales bacterium]
MSKTRRSNGKGSVRKLPSGKWQARVTYPDGTVHSLGTFWTKTDAERETTLATASVLRQDHLSAEREATETTLDEWTARWLAEGHWKPKTKSGYANVYYAHIAPVLGSLAIQEINRDDIRNLLGQLSNIRTNQPAGPTLTRSTYTVLRIILRAAVVADVISKNPCIAIPLPRSRRVQQEILTIAQIEQLAEAITYPHRKTAGNNARSVARDCYPEYGLLIRVAAYTGLRAGEIGALRRKHVNVSAGYLAVEESLSDVGGHLTFGPTKSYRKRNVPVPQMILGLLEAHLNTLPPDAEALVFTGRAGQPRRHEAFYQRHFQPAARRIGVPNLRFHDLRHTYASLLIAQGAHAKVIQERLGHSSIVVTLDTYGHLFPGMDTVVTAQLDASIRAVAENESGTNLAR